MDGFLQIKMSNNTISPSNPPYISNSLGKDGNLNVIKNVRISRIKHIIQIIEKDRNGIFGFSSLIAEIGGIILCGDFM